MLSREKVRSFIRNRQVGLKWFVIIFSEFPVVSEWCSVTCRCYQSIIINIVTFLSVMFIPILPIQAVADET